ncbi:WAS/WASL-interacting protein family member 2 isoform X5 [Carettochelys insculpta]|uniref:WAS/WASL-interacting protein family member 2 isoform X5 n=1 Tax=Carettochelys insculpta TaxID=44489 RepID=UPI003EB9E21F
MCNGRTLFTFLLCVPAAVGTREDSSSSKQSLQVPSSRSAAPRPPVPVNNSRPHDDSDSSRASPPELPRMQRPSLPDLSRPNSASSSGMKHSSSAPPPPPPGRRANAPPAPPLVHGSKGPSYNRDKPLPPTPGQRLSASRDGPLAPPPIKPPPSPVNVRTGPSAQNQSLAPPPPPYRQPPGVHNGPASPTNELAPELPQRHNSLHRKTPGPVRGLAPPPPSSASPSLQSSRPPPPAREPPSRGAGKSPARQPWSQLGHGGRWNPVPARGAGPEGLWPTPGTRVSLQGLVSRNCLAGQSIASEHDCQQLLLRLSVHSAHALHFPFLRGLRPCEHWPPSGPRAWMAQPSWSRLQSTLGSQLPLLESLS